MLPDQLPLCPVRFSIAPAHIVVLLEPALVLQRADLFQIILRKLLHQLKVHRTVGVEAVELLHISGKRLGLVDVGQLILQRQRLEVPGKPFRIFPVHQVLLLPALGAGLLPLYGRTNKKAAFVPSDHIRQAKSGWFSLFGSSRESLGSSNPFTFWNPF